MQVTKTEVLAAYGVTTAHRIGGGMEAEVYALDTANVLKLYHGTGAAANLQALQHFYANLDRAQLSYALPSIVKVAPHPPFTVTVEVKLSGAPLAQHIEAVQSPRALEPLFVTYTGAVAELARLDMPSGEKHYKLFDAAALSWREDGDWHHFLWRWVQTKRAALDAPFGRDVANYLAKVERIQAWLSTPYTGPHRLIHGDFCPANLLVNGARRATALLDFGLFTQYGDPLFDLATAWSFFDMYDELKMNVRQRLLDFIVARYGESQRGQLYRYLLLYSLLSANVYSPQCADGHYAWCVANWNSHECWRYF